MPSYPRGPRVLLFLLLAAASTVVVLLPTALGQVRPQPLLGPPLIVPGPTGPPSGSTETAIPRAPTFTTWFDTTSRSAIVTAYTAYLVPTAPTSVGWTGSVDPSPGNPGSTSQAYQAAALTRINWVRALAGVPASITFNSTFSTEDQAAALIMSANDQLSHTPPSTWKDWTQAGFNAAGSSNLCLGYSVPEFLSQDPGCVLGYMDDTGANNEAVGHRRWLLAPQTQSMGTGDVTQFPAGANPPTYWSANAVFVIDGTLFNSRPATRDNFVAWPPPGYVPYQVIPADTNGTPATSRWSVSYGNADFSSATVTMSVGGANVPVTVLPIMPGPGSFIGESTLAWVPGTDFTGQPGSDTTVSVTISGVSGYPGGSTIQYNVIIFDPNSAATLQPPMLISPANGATGVSTTTNLNWSSSSGATSYDVYIGTPNPSLAGNVTGTSVSFSSPLLASTTYSWYIVAKNGSSTAQSVTWSFTTTGTAPVAPTLTSPANGATGVSASASLSWSSASGATSYDVYFGASSSPPLLTNTTSLSYGPSMAAGTLYYWKIVAKNSSGSTSSSIWSFTTAAATLQSPTLISPANGATGVSTTTNLNWSSSSGATSYDVYIGSPNPSLAGNVTGTSVSFSSPLLASTTYSWYIVAKNGSSTAQSVTWSFTTAGTAPVAPTLFSPANGATGVSASASLSWSIASGATSYDVYFGTSNAPPLLTNTTNISYGPSVAAGTLYYWKIVAKNSLGSTSSSTWSFTTAAATLQPPTLISPANGATGVSITTSLNWASSSGATSYDVYIGSPNPSLAGNVTGTSMSFSSPLLASTTYSWYIVAKNGSSAAQSVTWSFTTAGTTTGGLGFVPVTPCRIMDTRNPTGPLGGPFIAAGTTRTVPVSSSSCGVPANAAAYSVNVTVVPRAGFLGYVSVWPTGQTQPVVSTLNSFDGSILANAAIVPAGAGGSINAFGSNDTDLVMDIDGYFITPGVSSLQFYPLAPCRVLDTRNPYGTFGGPALAGGTTRSFPIPSGPCGAPINAAAYALNVTVVPHGSLGYLTAWPTGESQPVVSTLNSFDGTILANAAIVPAGAGGAVSFFVTNTTDLVVDIDGYFAPPGTGGLNFYAVSPCRVVDTRNANGPLGGPIMDANTTRTFPLPGECGLPETAAAYSLNMTVDPPGPMGYLSVWPTGQAQPVVSTLNDFKGLAVANAALVPAGASGSINVYVTNTSHVIVDTNGYFQ